ncbi:MAG: leucine-rich repeat domain-containing protein, partial [Cyanobacteria bacterium J06626_4]
MKRAISLGLLTILLVIGVGCFGTPQGEIAPDQFATFADWCRHRDLLPRAPRQTVDKLLGEAGTKECNQAEGRLTHLTELYLPNKQIVDVAPLASLTNLILLYLDANQIVDVTPL